MVGNFSRVLTATSTRLRAVINVLRLLPAIGSRVTRFAGQHQQPPDAQEASYTGQYHAGPQHALRQIFFAESTEESAQRQVQAPSRKGGCQRQKDLSTITWARWRHWIIGSEVGHPCCCCVRKIAASSSQHLCCHTDGSPSRLCQHFDGSSREIRQKSMIYEAGYDLAFARQLHKPGNQLHVAPCTRETNQYPCQALSLTYTTRSSSHETLLNCRRGDRRAGHRPLGYSRCSGSTGRMESPSPPRLPHLLSSTGRALLSS